MNFNANAFVSKATKREAAASINMKDALLAWEKAGYKFEGVKVVHSKKRGDRDVLLLGTFDETGFSVNGTDLVAINISNKLQLSGATHQEKFMEIYENYPIFYGQRVIKSEDNNDEGDKTINWMTVAPVGTYEAAPAAKIDFSALLSANSKAGVPTMG